MTSYFMNDQVGASDDMAFAAHGLVALLIAATLMTLTLHKSAGVPFARAATTALLSSAVIHALFLAITMTLVHQG